MFRPSGQVQQPLLMEAIQSLKIVDCLKDSTIGSTTSGNIVKYTIKENRGVKQNGAVKDGRKTISKKLGPYLNALIKYDRGNFKILKNLILKYPILLTSFKMNVIKFYGILGRIQLMKEMLEIYQV